MPKDLRHKIDAKGKKMVMVGYSSGVQLWDQEQEKIVAARNVIFDEE